MAKRSESLDKFWPMLLFSLGLIVILFGVSIKEPITVIVGAILLVIDGGYLWVMAMIIEPMRVKTPVLAVSKNQVSKCHECGKILKKDRSANTVEQNSGKEKALSPALGGLLG
ncbi:MAG: hypothetical protein OEV21_06480 [Thermoplasmata archaeon]|nr:hypothetical protein [Thermoplasmata archaeon]